MHLVEDSGQLVGIADGGPWPDVLQIVSVASCGALFELSAQTYHGAGGGRRPLRGEDAG
jgi:hypothetical protein